MLPKKKKKHSPSHNAYLNVKQEYLNNGGTTTAIVPPEETSSSGDETGLSDLRLRASEKRDILLYYILENFYTIDEVHKNKLYAFLLKLTETKAIDFDPFVQTGLYSNFRKQLDQVMLELKSKSTVLPLLHGIHSSDYSNNMISRATIDFESVCFLGKGGFGEVIKAKNRIDGALYALKKVKFRDLPNSAKNLEKVLREVKALAQLDHENVLRYYNAWIEVEHGADYTKKMMEAVSHNPFSPLSPLSPPPSPQPKISVSVSEFAEESEGSEDSDESSNEGSEWSESSKEIKSNGLKYATSTTEGEEGETESEEDGEEEEEDEENEEEEEGEDSSSGMNLQFVDSNESSSHGRMHGINMTKSSSSNNNNYYFSSGESSGNSDLHNITTLTESASSTSSHGSRHGINVPVYSTDESSGIERSKSKSKSGLVSFENSVGAGGRGGGERESGKGKKKVFLNHRNVNSSATRGSRLRKSMETVISNFRRGVGEVKKDESESGDEGEEDSEGSEEEEEREEKERRTSHRRTGSDETEVWVSSETSASKNYSHELTSSIFPSNDNKKNGNKSKSKNGGNKNKSLAVVPFAGVTAPPKNRYVLYIQMQLCESKTLKTFLEKPNRLVSGVENMVMFSQIVSGLGHIHSRGLIHRDLKPENIFFTSSGSIKIGDFGLSKKFCDITGEGKQMFETECLSPHTVGIGTRSYASPEQIKSNFYTVKSDIYSLGIILFELFIVFETYTERAKVLIDLRNGILPTSMWNKFPDVARCVLWLMDEVPENRPTTEDILRSTFMTMTRPRSVASLVVQQQEEIDRLQEKISKLQEQLRLTSV